MLGTTEGRRFLGPSGSQTHHQQQLQLQQQQQPPSLSQHILPQLHHPTATFPFFPPYPNFQHLAALHAGFGSLCGSAAPIATTTASLAHTATTSNLWPSSPTLSSTTGGHSHITPSNAAATAVSTGRLSAFDFQTNGEVTDSLFAAGGYSTPSGSAPYLPSFGLVAKNFQAAAAQFSQAKSLFLQSQQTAEFLGGTISTTTKKTETCFGRWQSPSQQHQHALEPLHIQVPPISATTNISIKSENISSGSSASSQHQQQQQHSNSNNSIKSLSSTGSKVNGFEPYRKSRRTNSSSTSGIYSSSSPIVNHIQSPAISPQLAATSFTLSSSNASAFSPSSSLSLPLTHTTTTAANTTTSVAASTHTTTNTIHSIHDITSGCSRTIPISWNNSGASASLLQIKREPCQVSEITTSNNFHSTTTSTQQQPNHQNRLSHTNNNNQHQLSVAASVKVETRSPRATSSFPSTSSSSVLVSAATMDHNNTNQVQTGAIPVGIAVARQRLQEHAQQQQHHQPKDINRFGSIGITTDLGGATSAFSQQNMFYTGTNSTMIPYSSDAATAAAVSMGVSNAVQSAVRTPPTLWQYPTPVPVEPMLPMPPVPFQLVRDPSSGQFLFLPTAMPTATSIDKYFISYPSEPFQQAVVWPTYSQPQTTIQAAPHLLMPPMAAQSMQPPPLAPLLLGTSDYLTASTTLHQHTQTHSTRLVALASDNNNKRKTSHNNSGIPMPIQSAPTLIKIEDCSGSAVQSANATNCGTLTPLNHHASYEPKSAAIQTATITTAVQTNDMAPDIAAQLSYYQTHGLHGNLIQIAPHTSTVAPLTNNNTSITVGAAIMGTLDCRSLQQQTANILTPPDVTMSTMSCLTPISETYSRSDENLDSSGVSSLPEVQDATIQTDTPVMSEDDNTNGADDSAYSSNVIINQNSLTDELNIAVPTSTSCSDMCHSITNISDNSNLMSPINASHQITSPQFTNYTSELIHSSSNSINLGISMNNSSGISTSSDNGKSVECSFEAAVSSTNMIEDERSLQQRSPEGEIGCSISNLRAAQSPQQPTDLSINSASAFVISAVPQEKHTQNKSSAPDLSGLELLSNSIEAFEKRPFIKQEPIERVAQISPSIYESQSYSPRCSSAIDENRRLSMEISNQFDAQNKSIEEQTCTPPVPVQQPSGFVSANEQLGGLNLLCALAEQHFQEEVGNRSDRKRSSSSEGSEPKRAKKHKEKHSSKKSKKKDRKEKKRRTSGGSNGISSTEDGIAGASGLNEKEFKDTFDQVKAKYMKCECRKTVTSEEPCRCKANWPTPEEVYSVMKSEMRIQLAEIKRKVKEEERKLDAINSKDIRLQRESTPSSSKSSSSCSKLSLTSVPTFSPSILSTSSLDCNQSSTVEFTSNGKAPSDTESCSSTSSKRKVFADSKATVPVGDAVDSQAKKNKSLVGYIFASKKRLNDSKFDSNFSTTDEASVNSDISATLKRASMIKHEAFDFDESSSQPEINLFGNFADESGRVPNKKQHLSGLASDNTKVHKLSKHSAASKHHKKIKTGKERKHHRRSSEHRERRRRIDSKCMLTPQHLDNLADGKKQRVLTAMGGLFYAGCLNAVQPPDVYAVTLDGERGNRPHIMSREDILRDAILEVAPTSADEIPPSTRLCAYWSQQYRCLYPGTAASSTSPEHDPDSKYIVVEFDDGDSGRIAVEDIRFLMSDYPIVEYDPNPLLSLGKRKQKTGQSTEHTESSLASGNEPSTSTNCFSFYHEPNTQLQTREEKEANKERRRLKKLRKDKLRQQLSLQSSTDDPNNKRHKHKHKCGDELCKHRKHKKRRKHKKHHHRELDAVVESPTNSSCAKKESNDDEDDYDEEDDEVDSGDSVETPPETTVPPESPKLLAAKNTLTKTVNIKINKLVVKDHTDVFNVKEDALTEEDIVSSITDESSGSSYNPGKTVKERQASSEKHSKIAAFLPARQLWAWHGKSYKRNAGKGARNKKHFYKTIQRGKETISVGDSAVFLSTGRPDRPYIGRIESLWETHSNNRVVKVKWYYHPEETTGCPDLLYPGALFESPHEDENDVQTISHKCKVLALDAYTNKYGPDPKQYTSVYENNDTFYLAGHYDPTILQLKMEKNIPTKTPIEQAATDVVELDDDDNDENNDEDTNSTS